MSLFQRMRALYLASILEMDEPLRHFSPADVQALRLEVAAESEAPAEAPGPAAAPPPPAADGEENFFTETVANMLFGQPTKEDLVDILDEYNLPDERFRGGMFPKVSIPTCLNRFKDIMESIMSKLGEPGGCKVDTNLGIAGAFRTFGGSDGYYNTCLNYYYSDEARLKYAGQVKAVILMLPMWIRPDFPYRSIDPVEKHHSLIVLHYSSAGDNICAWYMDSAYRIGSGDIFHGKGAWGNYFCEGYLNQKLLPNRRETDRLICTTSNFQISPNGCFFWCIYGAIAYIVEYCNGLKYPGQVIKDPYTDDVKTKPISKDDKYKEAMDLCNSSHSGEGNIIKLDEGVHPVLLHSIWQSKRMMKFTVLPGVPYGVGNESMVRRRFIHALKHASLINKEDSGRGGFKFTELLSEDSMCNYMEGIYLSILMRRINTPGIEDEEMSKHSGLYNEYADKLDSNGRRIVQLRLQSAPVPKDYLPPFDSCREGKLLPGIALQDIPQDGKWYQTRAEVEPDSDCELDDEHVLARYLYIQKTGDRYNLNVIERELSEAGCFGNPDTNGIDYYDVLKERLNDGFPDLTEEEAVEKAAEYDFLDEHIQRFYPLECNMYFYDDVQDGPVSFMRS